MSIMATLDPLLLTPIREEADFTDLQEDRAFVKYARSECHIERCYMQASTHGD